MNVNDVVDEVSRIIDEGQEAGMWPSAADLEALLARFPQPGDDADDELSMSLARDAVDYLHRMAVLAANGYTHSIQMDLGFFFLKQAVSASRFS